MPLPLYRPPAEADSLILQVAYGCPNNTCAFCGMYKGRPYTERLIPDIEAEIRTHGPVADSVRRLFLSDGDVMHMAFARLEALLILLNRAFPNLARVAVYANSLSILSKSARELSRLRDLKLATAYVGLESGSDEVLESLTKKDRSTDAIRAAELARDAGIRLSVMVLIGAGGQRLSARHAGESARVLNLMQPPLLSMLTLIPIPGTPLIRKIKDGVFTPLNKEEVLVELKDTLGGLELRRTVFRCNHTSNPLPLEGRFPKDKGRLISEIDTMLRNRVFLCDDHWAEPWML